MKRFLEVGSLNLLRKQFVKPNAPQVSRQDAFPRVEGVLGTLWGSQRKDPPQGCLDASDRGAWLR